MPDKSAERVAHAFADAINRHSPEALAALMTEDHIFIDSLGARVQGRVRMQDGWAAYFGMVADYTITVEETYSTDGVVVMVGSAQGTYAGESWHSPAAWRASIQASLVAEWRVYADNEPIRALMRKAAAH